MRLVRTNLKPAEPVPAEEVAGLLADAPEFRRREAAAALARLGPGK